MAEDVTTADPPAEEQDRLGRLEDKVDRLADIVGKLVPGSREEAGKRTESRLDRSSDIQEQVQAELAKAREAEARQRAQDAEKSEQEQLRETVRKLAERPPEPPTPRRTRMLGWGP